MNGRTCTIVATTISASLNDILRIQNRSFRRRPPPDRVLAWETEIPKMIVGIAIVKDDDTAGSGVVAGYIMGWPRGEKSSYIGFLAVEPEMRRLKLGCRLVRWFEERSGEEGFPSICLHFHGGEPETQAFWNSLGYFECDREENGYGPGEDAVFSSRALNTVLLAGA